MKNIDFSYLKDRLIITVRGGIMMISLVGLSGSGKTTIAKLLCTYNEKIIHLDIDKVAHFVLKNTDVKKKLVDAFGPSILYENEINRSKLRSIVFTSPENMNLLAQITWPYMEAIIDEFIKKHPYNIIILDYLLLPKTKYFQMSDLRILVTASEEARISRIQKRDNISEEKYRLRNANAPSLNPEDYDYVISTENEHQVKEEVGEIYAKSIIHR